MKCKLCNNLETTEILVKNRSWEKKYYMCEECNFIFAETAAVLDAAEQFKRYKMHNNKLEDQTYREYFKRFIDFAFKEIEKKKKILDFGSGPEPVLADVLKELNYEVTIYDKFFAEDESVFNNKYEIITSTEVFEHLEYPQKYIERLLNSLDDDGYLILMTCFHSDDAVEFSKWWYIQDPTHISFFSLKTFKYLAEQNNLEIVKQNNKNIIVFRKKKC